MLQAITGSILMAAALVMLYKYSVTFHLVLSGHVSILLMERALSEHGAVNLFGSAALKEVSRYFIARGEYLRQGVDIVGAGGALAP